jgi:hypothetical protein
MGLFGRKKFPKRNRDPRDADESDVEDEIISHSLARRDQRRGNQAYQSSDVGVSSGLLRFQSPQERVQTMQTTMWAVVQHAAADTPMEMKATRTGVIIHKAKLCYIDNVELAQNGRYYRKHFQPRQ